MKRPADETVPDIEYDEDDALPGEDELTNAEWRMTCEALEDSLYYAVYLASIVTGLHQDFFIRDLGDPGN